MLNIPVDFRALRLVMITGLIVRLLCRESTDKQPDYFDDVQDFVDFVRAHPKKGAEMSHFTVDKLYNMWEEYREVDQTASDPVGNFIARNARRLGFRKNGDGRFSSCRADF